MKTSMRKARLLAESLQGLLDLVTRAYEEHHYYVQNEQSLYRLKSLVDEHRFQLYVDELNRLNTFSWDEKQTITLINRVGENIKPIEEYVFQRYNDLFLFSGRIHSIKSIIASFMKDGNE